MSLIPHVYFPRSMFDMDSWMKPSFGLLSTLDAFDPFDELDNALGRNMLWLHRPDYLALALPRVPQKYRITLDCAGYSPKSIKTDVKDNVLTVSAREDDRSDKNGDYSVREFKKTYKLPEHALADKMVSFMTRDGQLCIEVPLKESARHRDNDLFPEIVDENGSKAVKMKFSVPGDIPPENISINIKDRSLVVQAEDKKVDGDNVSKFHYYKKTLLPENTDFDALKCSYDSDTHQISVSAPLNLDWTPSSKKITLEHKGKPAITEQTK